MRWPRGAVTVPVRRGGVLSLVAPSTGDRELPRSGDRASARIPRHRFVVEEASVATTEGSARSNGPRARAGGNVPNLRDRRLTERCSIPPCPGARTDHLALPYREVILADVVRSRPPVLWWKPSSDVIADPNRGTARIVDREMEQHDGRTANLVERLGLAKIAPKRAIQEVLAYLQEHLPEPAAAMIADLASSPKDYRRDRTDEVSHDCNRGRHDGSRERGRPAWSPLISQTVQPRVGSAALTRRRTQLRRCAGPEAWSGSEAMVGSVVRAPWIAPPESSGAR
jgi:hypothetical protein